MEESQTVSVSEETVQRFAELFAGYDRAHGRYEEKGAESYGKVKGKGTTIPSPVSLLAWREHLTGSGAGVGIIPLTAENTCHFAAIDIDINPDRPRIDLEAIAKQARAYGLITCRSKSGGAHCYAFFRDPAPASEVRAALEVIAADMGYGGVEVFPKQEERTSDRDIGNWLNLPYYGGETSMRYCYSPEHGRSLDPLEFLDYAEKNKLDSLDASPQGGDELEDGPPCLQTLLSRGGFPEGTRNDGMFAVGVYLRKAYPDDWEDRLLAWNQKMCDVPLGLREIQGIAKSVGKKEYAYPCKKAPIKNHCNRRLCLTRTHGVGGGPDSQGVEIVSLTKYPAQPVLWCVEIGGRRVEMDTKTLHNHSAFSMICMEQVNRCPPPMNPVRWRQLLDKLLANCDEVPPPADADEGVQFRYYVESWLYGRSQAKTRDEMLLGKPWHFEGRVHFLSTSLIERMNRDGFKFTSPHQVWRKLSTVMGARKEKGVLLQGKLYREPWSVPMATPDGGDLNREESTVAESMEEF